MSRFKSFLKSALPEYSFELYRKIRIARMQQRNLGRSTEAVFTDIYAKNLWGGEKGEFCSGSGSRDAEIVEKYVTNMSIELQKIGAASMTVVDLGCGDFTVGRQLIPHLGKYIGVDIVRELVEYNSGHLSSDKVIFLHRNIIEDQLPDGEVCFVRQVLQHLSNEQIGKVLSKLHKYRWSFITEHYPSKPVLQKNSDKPHGADTRVDHGSGVYLDAPPFDSVARSIRFVFEVPGQTMAAGMDPGVIRTYAIEAQA
jgi:hypothetical protein